MKNKELTQMKELNSIFDIILFSYSQIEGIQEDKYYREYLNLQKESCQSVWKNINILFEALLSENITAETFCRKAKKIADSYKFSLYVHLLIIFDAALEDREKYSILHKKFKINRSIEQTGPIYSSYIPYKLYYFFHKESDIRNNIIEKLGIRTRKIKSGIWEYIENYIIVSDSEKYDIRLYEYTKDCIKNLLTTKNLKVGIVPNRDKLWEKEEQPKGFYDIVLQQNKDSMDCCNKEYIRILEKAEQEGVNIIVFPELAINLKIINYLKIYLAENSLKGNIKNLKLIFTGSLCEDHHNVCYLISSQGTVLINNEKKIAYRDKAGRMEVLNVMSNEINLIDIKGLGRIWYAICKDAIEHKNVTDIYHYYGVHWSVISAFSESIDPFVTEAETIAKEYYASCLTANSCQARKNGVIGFMSLPGAEIKRKNSRCSIYEYQCPYILQEKCICNCIHIFNIFLDEVEESEGMQCIKIEKKCVDTS